LPVAQRSTAPGIIIRTASIRPVDGKHRAGSFGRLLKT